VSYATLTDLKTYLGVGTTADDALLSQCLTRAQGFLEAQTTRVFEASADTTRYLDAAADVVEDEQGRGSLLILPADLCAVTSVTNGDGVAVAASEYVTEPRGSTPYWALRLKANATVGWTYTTTPENAISIVGRWAYSTTPPADVVQACLALATYFYRQRGAEATGMEPVMSQSGVVMLPPRIPDVVKAVIARYQRVGTP